MKKITIFGIILIIVYVGAFFIPHRVDRFALDPAKVSEFWRFVTYPFIHLNSQHLIENSAALALIIFIALELKTAFSDFSSTYLSSGFLSVLPIWIALSFTVLGASNAIFGGFGLISQETKKYDIKGSIILFILTGLVFIKSILSFFSYGGVSEQFGFAIKQDLAHFSGLAFGVAAFFVIKKLKPMITRNKRFALRSSST